MKRKQAVYKGLEFIDVLFTDTSLTSPNYFQITEFPTRLTAGKNLFKLRGHPTNLAVGGVLNIEVLDYNGDPIYYEIIDYIDEDKSRVISIYIYEDSSPGDCTITLVAEANTINGQPVPDTWKQRPNVKWVRTVPVNPNISNDSEIIFESNPTVSIREQIGPQLLRSYTAGQFPTYTTGTVKYFEYNGAPAVLLTGGTFTQEMKTGTITVSTPINPQPQPTYTPSTTQYTSEIKKILSPTVALLDSSFTVYSSQSISSHTYTSFDDSAFLLTYEATPIYTETQNSESFALVEIKGLEPATGDVSRVKMFMNNNGTIGTWEQIADTELDETEIFVTSTSSIYPDASVGIIEDQTVINTYWSSFSYQGNTILTAPTLTYETTNLIDSVNVSSATDISAENAVNILQVNQSYKGVFIKDASYKITLDAYGIRQATDGNLPPKFSVFMSGSSFDYDPTIRLNQELPRTLGKFIGTQEITGTSRRFDDIEFEFEADKTGTGVLLLVIHSGEWNFADIRTTTDNDAGYTPGYTRIRTLVPTAQKIDNQLTFKIEYYNVAGVRSKLQSFVYDLDWEGGNRYIDGDYSMLTGSLYVADSLESGVAISGYPNSGFIRSLGYDGFESGFPGFMMWSGSALPGQNTKNGNPYSGVGLELYLNTSSYFRYSTADDELYVATQNFFFGDPDTAFISGSNSNIEISSSNFHLKANGDVTASNMDIAGVAQANVIRNKTITVDASNSGSYLQQVAASGTPQTLGYIQSYYNLVLDGTLGGEIIQHVIIDCGFLLYTDTTSPGATYYLGIGGIKLPGITSNVSTDCVIEVATDGVYFNTSVGGFESGVSTITTPQYYFS